MSLAMEDKVGLVMRRLGLGKSLGWAIAGGRHGDETRHGGGIETRHGDGIRTRLEVVGIFSNTFGWKKKRFFFTLEA